jgi:hypothetical protein
VLGQRNGMRKKMMYWYPKSMEVYGKITCHVM